MSSSRRFAAACVAVSCITNRACVRGGVGEIESSGVSRVLHRARRVARNEAIALDPLANMQHRAPTFRSVCASRRAARPRGPRAVLLTYLSPREPRPRGLDQIGVLGVGAGDAIVSRVYSLHLGRYNLTRTCQPRRAPATACASTRDQRLRGERLPVSLRGCARLHASARARHSGGARGMTTRRDARTGPKTSFER